MRVYLIALGANLGRNLEANARSVAHAAGVVARRIACRAHLSRLYRTPAWPPAAGADFVNAAMAIETDMTPGALLDLLHHVERQAGRVRGRRWSARALDLDLLAAGQLVRPDPAGQMAWRALGAEAQAKIAPDRLILPHPRLQDRAFVLVPLAEIAPAWRHPLTGRRVADMVRALPASQRAAIRPIRTPHGVVKPKGDA